MLNKIIVSAFDTDWAWDGENSISVDIPAKTPAEAMSIKKNLRRLAGSNNEVLVKAFTQWRENNAFTAANLRYTDRVRAKHSVVVSEEDYNSDYYDWCAQMDEKYNHEDKVKAFLAKIERGLEVSHTRAQVRYTDFIASRAILESERKKAFEFAKAAGAELKMKPDEDDEELPF